MTGRGWGEIVRQAQAETVRNRALVLAHPDLAERLTEYPLHLEKPEQWTGYLPPVTFDGAHNDSPIRAQLVDILTDALARVEPEPEEQP